MSTDGRPTIVIVAAEPGGTFVPDGTRRARLVGGPADGVELELPASGELLASRVRLTVDGQPHVYFNVTRPIYPTPETVRVYCWDDPSTRDIPIELQRRIQDAQPGRRP
jgi:hypothetical protein